MDSPLIVLIELIVGLISRTSESLTFIFSKIIEFFASLQFVSGIGGIIVVAIVGAIVLLFALKFFFKASKTLIILWLIFIVVLAFLVIALLL
jgi:hypothetical protein